MALGLVTGIIAVLAVGCILCINDNSRKKGARPRRGTDDDLMLKHWIGWLARNAQGSLGAVYRQCSFGSRFRWNGWNTASTLPTAHGTNISTIRKRSFPHWAITRSTTEEEKEIFTGKTINRYHVIFSRCRQPNQPTPPQNSCPADVGTAFRSDREIADLIERSIARLIPSIADESVRYLHTQMTASPTISFEHDQDADMDITRLRDEALHSRQAGWVPDHHCPATFLPAVHRKVLHQIKNGEFVEFNLLLPSHAPATNNLVSRWAFHIDWETSVSG